jgi:hypothetical protein
MQQYLSLLVNLVHNWLSPPSQEIAQSYSMVSKIIPLPRFHILKFIYFFPKFSKMKKIFRFDLLLQLLISIL